MAQFTNKACSAICRSTAPRGIICTAAALVLFIWILVAATIAAVTGWDIVRITLRVIGIHVGIRIPCVPGILFGYNFLILFLYNLSET